MVAKIQERRCLWPAFSRYEVQDGRVVPASGAKLHWYDPWKKYAEARNQNRNDPAYMSLVSLIKQFSKDWRERGRDLSEDAALFHVERTQPFSPIPDASVKSILAWSAEHGLLGIFHQTTIQLEEPIGGGAWAWSNGRWQRSPIWPPRQDDQDRTCLVTGITDPEHLRQKARPHLLKFFAPDIPKELPAPDSDSFFMLYGEHLWDWLWAAITTVEAIVEGHSPGLNFLTGSAIRIRHFEKNPVRTEMVFRSLLSAFAEMYAQDREGGTFIGDCAECGGPFTTDRVWTKHCSTKCATKARQRRFLEKHPDYYKNDAKPTTGANRK